MSRGTRRAALAVAIAAGLLLMPAAAVAATPTTPASDGDVVVDPPLTRPGAVYPVERLLFPQASADGAIVDTGDGAFRMAADVMFEFDRSNLTPRAGDEIVRIAAELRAAQPGLQAVEVIGHTDATGDDAYNQRLSEQRAQSVRGALATALGPGVEVRATGRGETEPIADNATPEGQSLNRRVEIRIAGQDVPPAAPAATAGDATGPIVEPSLVENRPVLASAVVRAESGPTPHDVQVELNMARVSGNVLQLMFTARSLNPATPVFGDGSWTVGGLFGDRLSGEADAPDSVDGVYLLDPVNGTRLLPGRNPDGTCLCSGGLTGAVVAPGTNVVLMADFAAPPGAVTAVDVAVPGAGVFAGIPLTR